MSKKKAPFDRPMVHRIRIKGHLDTLWSDWLEGLTIIPEADGETLLCGLVSDQAALYGLLKKIGLLFTGLPTARQRLSSRHHRSFPSALTLTMST